MVQEVRNNYFNWICGIVINNEEGITDDYIILLSSLFNREFTYSHPMDKNRYIDGLELRSRFAMDVYGGDENLIINTLGLYKCSILEMMVALSLRCEEIMQNGELNRTHIWFLNMIHSLYLDDLSDYNFDDDVFEQNINKFLNREYAYNGNGGLFTLANPIGDLRDIEIWYQMMMWLKEWTLRNEGTYINY